MLRAISLLGVLILTLGGSTWSRETSSPVRLEQGWSAKERRAFYTTAQGSQVMPLSWFKALERADGREAFLADGLARHGYLPNPPSPGNPSGLPVGFTVDRDGRRRWLGLTCAACHTGQIEYQGTRIRIDGGAASSADIHALFVEIEKALVVTVADRDGARYRRFSKRVLRRYSKARADALFARVTAFLEGWRAFLRDSSADTPWGPGRLDGFGMTFNRIAAIGLGIPGNSAPPDGAVSYPFLWGASWHDRTQWNGSVVSDTDLGRLGRNVGEVLGVFGKFRARKPSPGHRYYRTTAKRDNLVALEELIKRLQAPQWPEEILGPIDRSRAERGAILYERHCSSCHPVVPRDAPPTIRRVEMTPVIELGTDPTAAWNICSRTVDPGRLQGAFLNAALGAPLPDPVPSLTLLRHLVAGAILAPGDGVSGAAAAGRGSRPDSAGAPAGLDCGPDSSLMRYKARHLDGVWATAPYLHNGSVPSLHALLLPPEERPARFHVGDPAFDARRVGLLGAPSSRSRLFDTTLPGNRATGHTYGTRELTVEQRRALVEYLKTL